MSLYELKQADLDDLLALVSGASLTITANNAPRVYQLQAILRGAKPSNVLEVLEVARKQCDDMMRARDGALLELGLMTKRADELEQRVSEQERAYRT